MSFKIIGQSTPRTDNTGKVTGEARYTSDVLLPGTLWAKTLRSPFSHARIKGIDISRALKAPGVRAVLTGSDVHGILYGRRYRDISVLAQDRVRFMGERVAAVAAETLEQAENSLGVYSDRLRRTAYGIRSGVGASRRGAAHPSRCCQL